MLFKFQSEYFYEKAVVDIYWATICAGNCAVGHEDRKIYEDHFTGVQGVISWGCMREWNQPRSEWDDLGVSLSSRSQMYFLLRLLCITLKVILGIPTELWHCCKDVIFPFLWKEKKKTKHHMEPVHVNGNKIDHRSPCLRISVGFYNVLTPNLFL